MKQNNNITVPDAVQEFLATKQAEGKTASTLRNYEYACEPFAQHVGRIPVQKISSDLIVDFLNSFGANKVDSTRYQCATDVRAFINYLVSEQYLDEAPAFNLPMVGEQFVELLSPQEWMDVYQQLDVRDRAIMQIITETGMLLSELPNLCWGDVDCQNGMVYVTASDGTIRVVPIDAQLLDLLAEVRQRSTARRFSTSDDDPVFVGRTGAGLNRQGVQSLFRRIKRNTGVPISAKALRDFFAFHSFYKEGLPLDVVRAMLGHSDIQITIDMLERIDATAQLIAQDSSNAPLKYEHNRSKVA